MVSHNKTLIDKTLIGNYLTNPREKLYSLSKNSDPAVDHVIHSDPDIDLVRYSDLAIDPVIIDPDMYSDPAKDPVTNSDPAHIRPHIAIQMALQYLNYL